jgi:hypothetical protein
MYSSPGSRVGRHRPVLPFTSVFNVRDPLFGASGVGLFYDHTAIQAAITAAQIVGGSVFIPAGSYRIGVALSVTSRVTIQGVGYQADNTKHVAAAGYTSTVLVVDDGVTCFAIASPEPAIIEKLMITYIGSAPAGSIGVSINAGSGGTANINVHSIIRDVYFEHNNIGVKAINGGLWTIDHCIFDTCVLYGIWAQSLNNIGSGDCSITNCSIVNNTLLTAAIYLTSLGGLRINNNKINGPSTYGIWINPDQTSAASLSPANITGNSIEGPGTGIGVSQVVGQTLITGYLTITGNEISGSSYGIRLLATASNGILTTNLTIVGNTVICTGTACIAADGVNSGTISDNNLYSGGATVTGVLYGAHNQRLFIGNNPKGAGITDSGVLDQPYPPNWMSGCAVSNDSGGTTALAVAAGGWRDSTNVDNIQLAAALTGKVLGTAWSVGSAGGLLDTGAIANNTYHIFLIKRADTGVVDVLASLSATAPTLPTGYTLFRRIWSVRRVAGAIELFSALGNESLRLVPSQDLANGTWNTTASLVTCGVPTGIQVGAIVFANYGGGSTIYGLITSPDQTDTLPAATNFNMLGTSSAGGVFYGTVRTNASGQMRARTAVSSGASANVFTRGWIDYGLALGK